MSELRGLIVLGHTQHLVEDLFPQLDPDKFIYIDQLAELVEEMDDWDVENVTNTLIAHAKAGLRLYLGAVDLNQNEKKALKHVDELYPQFIIDEALEDLRAQVGAEVTGPESFQDAVIEALDRANITVEKVLFGSGSDETTVEFFAPGKLSSPHTIKWAADGAVEIDGAILRPTAVMGVGHFKTELLGPGVLTIPQVLGFIAARLAVNGVEDLVGYGRAFGPGREDQTNATLSPRSRRFRAEGVVGVVQATKRRVSKARPEMVVEVARLLKKKLPGTPLWLHQQCKEIYYGEAAVEAFRAQLTPEGKWRLFGKSTKHTRVDAGAYCLYTENDGYIRVPALVGQFDVSDDGMVYAPKAMMDTIDGWLIETVKAVKDFETMSPEMIVRYYSSEVLVTEGQRIEPGDVVFTVDGVPHTWESKADYGIVRHIIDEATTKMVRVVITIEAHFVGDLKIRGYGKGLVAPMEACGVSAQHWDGQDWVPSNRFIIGVPGIVKDSAAAAEYTHNRQPVVGAVEVEFCERDYEKYKRKHQPIEDAEGRLVKSYGSLTLYFYDDLRRVIQEDQLAELCEIDVMIEASPVGQSVGNSAMTMPQLAWLSSLPSGMEWIDKTVLPGIARRADALAYLHKVANQVVGE